MGVKIVIGKQGGEHPRVVAFLVPAVRNKGYYNAITLSERIVIDEIPMPFDEVTDVVVNEFQNELTSLFQPNFVPVEVDWDELKNIRWTDPSGGIHDADEDDPARQYE